MSKKDEDTEGDFIATEVVGKDPVKPKKKKKNKKKGKKENIGIANREDDT